MASSEPISTPTPPCNTVIFDLGDVLFTWSAETTTTISPRLLRDILNSPVWFEYEKGNISEDEAYNGSASLFDISAAEVGEAFKQARDSLKSSPEMIALIKELKFTHGVKVFAMSNISAPDWAVLKTKATAEEWALFNIVFTSAEARERKPNAGFYEHVLKTTAVEPARTVFVDDKPENVATAVSLGVNGVVFDSFEEVSRKVKTLLGI